MMQFSESLVPVVVSVIIGALIPSIILGPLLRRHKGSISGSSILVKLGLLIVLAIAVGSVIFVGFVSEVLL